MRYPLYLRFTLVRDCQSGIMTSYPNMFAFQWKAAPCCQLLKSVLGYQRVSLCVLQLFARYMTMEKEKFIEGGAGSQNGEEIFYYLNKAVPDKISRFLGHDIKDRFIFIEHHLENL